MNATTLDVGTLAGRWIGREGLRGLAARLALVVAGAALLTIAAKIKVPFYPVPMTLQTLAVFFIGATLGARLGALSVILYVTEGLVGFPVFTNTPPAVAGPAYLMGPTGGYLLGFLMAALIVGNAARRGLDRSVWRFAMILAMADVVLFACGLSWLMTSLGIDVHRAVQIGLLPFLPGEVLKIAVAAFAMPLLWQATARLRRG